MPFSGVFSPFNNCKLDATFDEKFYVYKLMGSPEMAGITTLDQFYQYMEKNSLLKNGPYWTCVEKQINDNTPVPKFGAGSPLEGMNTKCDSKATY